MGRRDSTVGTLAFVLSLALAGDASAATCQVASGTVDWNAGGNWSCGHIPLPDDTAIVESGDRPNVTSSPLAEPGELVIADGGRIVFSNGAALRVGDMTALTGSITGEGSLTVEDTFVKDQLTGGGLSTFSVTNEFGAANAPDLVLDGPATFEGGNMCIGRGDDADPDEPNLVINDTFRITDDPEVARFVFPCTNGPRIRVNAPDGHLIVEAGDPTTEFGTMVVNDGTLTVETGRLVLGGGTADETSDGAYLASEDATLEFAGSFQVGPTGRVGGAGTIDMKALPMTMAAGATLDPAVLDLSFGHVNLEGSAPVTLPVFKLNGVLDSDRPVTATTMSVTAGALQDDFTLTVPAGGSFTKTGDGTFAVTNSGGEGSADLVLDADATFDGGRMSIARTGTEPDRPNLYINRDFTIGPAVLSPAFQGGPQFGTLIHVNGPDGHLSKVGSGTTNLNDLDLAGGTLSVASGQTFAFANTFAQSAGVTEIASGGTLQASPTLTGGVLRGGGQVSGNVTNTGGTVRPAGTLTVDGAYNQGAGGTLEVDLATGEQDRLAVTGAASLAGTLAAVPATGFDPAPAAAFPVVTSGSRSGAFATLTGTRLPAGKRLALEYPDAPDFGARLVVTPPQDLVVTDCDDPALASVTEVTGDLIIDAVAGCDAVELPALTEVEGDVTIIDNPASGVIDISALENVGGSVEISGNTASGVIDISGLGSAGGSVEISGNTASGVIDASELGTVGGSVEITGNGSGEVELGSLEDVSGDLVVESTGAGEFDLGDAAVAGEESLETTGYDAVGGTTAEGATAVSSSRAEALMRAVLPAGAFTRPVPFSISRIDPAALPPEGAVDPVAAYRFEFGVPTLNSPAELTFDIRLAGLDQATREALLAGLADGRATLATRGDAPGSAFQTFPLCAAGQAPTAGGCVRAEQRSGGVVRFTGVVGQFSTWAVAIVAKPAAAPSPTPAATPAPTPAAPSKPAFGAPTLVTLTPAASRIRARGPLRIRVANANAFAVTGRLGGASAKRLGNRRAALPAKALSVPARAARTIALALPRAVRSRLARGRRVPLRVTATVTDPAGNRRTVTRRIAVRRR